MKSYAWLCLPIRIGQQMRYRRPYPNFRRRRLFFTIEDKKVVGWGIWLKSQARKEEIHLGKVKDPIRRMKRRRTA